ncbi:MAG: hypothetical protein QME47_05240 [Candidatus Thermoplasmatota archaeon]|nr:hypothetical protein [Candidatus Thermoplasmatota archaeon]
MRKICFLVLALVVLIPYFSAQSAVQPYRAQPTGHIESIYELKFVNMTKIELSAKFGIYKTELGGKLFTADAIRENSTNATLVEELKSEVDCAVNGVLSITFANDNITLEDTIVDNSSLSIELVNKGLPVNLTKNATITFNETLLGFKQKLNLSDFEEVLRGMLSAGAKLNKTFELSADPGYKNKFVLIAPEYALIKSEDEDYSNQTATWTVDNLNGTTKKSESKILSIAAKRIPQYTESKIDVFIAIDLYKIDIFKFSGRVNLSFSTLFYWGRVPSDFLPFESVTIDYINADLIRLMIAKELFEIGNLTKGLEEVFSNLTSIFGENVSMKIFVVNESLRGYDLTNMSGESPIEIRGHVDFEFKLKKEKKNFSNLELAIFEGWFTVPLNFPLQGFEECNTTFKLILPPGLKIFELRDTLGRAVKGNEKGRDYCELWLKGNETDEVYITLDLTPFIMNFTLPFIMIGIILGVAGIVIKIISWREERFIRTSL